MVRALVFGFILGFAMVGMLRVSAAREGGALLAESSAFKPGAAVNLAHFPDAHFPRRADYNVPHDRTERARGCPSAFWPMRTLA